MTSATLTLVYNTHTQTEADVSAKCSKGTFEPSYKDLEFKGVFGNEESFVYDVDI